MNALAFLESWKSSGCHLSGLLVDRAQLHPKLVSWDHLPRAATCDLDNNRAAVTHGLHDLVSAIERVVVIKNNRFLHASKDSRPNALAGSGACEIADYLATPPWLPEAAEAGA